MKKKAIYSLTLIMACLWGGYYDFSSALFCVLFSIVIMLIYRKKGQLLIPVNTANIGLLIVWGCYIFSVVIARDKGQAVLGIVKILVAVLFWIMWCNLEEKSKTICFRAIPWSGAVMNVIAFTAYFIPSAQSWFYRGYAAWRSLPVCKYLCDVSDGRADYSVLWRAVEKAGDD